MNINTRLNAVTESIQNILAMSEDDSALKPISVISNFVEDAVQEIHSVKNDNQRLKDELNRLKGEQGKPDIKENIKKGQGDVSSEKERIDAENLANGDNEKNTGYKFNQSALAQLKEQRIPESILNQLENIAGQKYSNEEEFVSAMEVLIGKEPTETHRSLLLKYAKYKKRNRAPKLPNIDIDREEICKVDISLLPKDAYLNGHLEKVVQDVVIKTDNVKFKREVYYSPSCKRTYTGKVPEGYEGDFGPHINADIVSMKYINGMSIPKIQEFYTNMGTIVSESYISTRLTKPEHMAVFHAEKSEMYQAAQEVSSYTQIDDTTTRVNGENQYTQIVCNEIYTAFFTTKRKDRLTILDVLRGFESRKFLLNDETFPLLLQLHVSQKHIAFLQGNKRITAYSEDEIVKILENSDVLNKKPRIKARIMEACAISAYRQDTGISIAKILVSDDAPQFKLITDELALCWIHEGRHYKRLTPVLSENQYALTAFLKRYWDYYRQLLCFKKNPTEADSKILLSGFDHLFSTITGYDSLDDRIAKSLGKKTELLVVLNHPTVPLHNNLSENGARVEKRRSDVSLQTKTDEGTRAKDTMMSIVETCKKLGVSGYKYIHDRVSKKNEMPSLASNIRNTSSNALSP